MNQHRRSIAKAVTWRIVATTDTIIIAGLITGKWTLGLAIGGIEVFTKMFIYYLHERAWNRSSYGVNYHNLTLDSE
ncbi:MAG TPA: DUF2061 domain-containing protein [Candidatus Saccharimonadales bacterium]|nr:DUF2061 domain-containing protein [Candidatus Saccharimonadales bacterium]